MSLSPSGFAPFPEFSPIIAPEQSRREILNRINKELSEFSRSPKIELEMSKSGIVLQSFFFFFPRSDLKSVSELGDLLRNPEAVGQPFHRFRMCLNTPPPKKTPKDLNVTVGSDEETLGARAAKGGHGSRLRGRTRRCTVDEV